MYILFIILSLIVVFLIFICFKSFRKNEFNMYFYNFGKYLCKPLFYFWYPFKKINKRVIPKDGPVIFACNHINILDQCLIIYSTDRPIHYMAKKEYFDNPKTRWFFSNVGCIPVNREIHDDDAKNKALNVLNKGLCFGIFPEGTRNQVSSKKDILNKVYKLYEKDYDIEHFKSLLKLNKVRVTEINLLDNLLNDKRINKKDYKEYLIKGHQGIKELFKNKVINEEEYNNTFLLPFKFGAVSMAKKTNATIVPVGIVGNYSFRTKNLKVKFGKPFKVGDMELSEANELLYKEILEILKSGE